MNFLRKIRPYSLIINLIGVTVWQGGCVVEVLGSVCVWTDPDFKSYARHNLAIRLDRLSQDLPGLHSSKQGRTPGRVEPQGSALAELNIKARPGCDCVSSLGGHSTMQTDPGIIRQLHGNIKRNFQHLKRLNAEIKILPRMYRDSCQ